MLAEVIAMILFKSLSFSCRIRLVMASAPKVIALQALGSRNKVLHIYF